MGLSARGDDWRLSPIIGHSTYQMALKYLAAGQDQKRAAAFMHDAAKRREGDGARR